MQKETIKVLGKECWVLAEFPATLEGLTAALKQPEPPVIVTQDGRIIFAEPV